MLKSHEARSRAAVKRAIAHFGTQKKMAQALGVTEPTVNHWNTGHRPIPAARAAEVHALTRGRVRKEDLLPEVFCPEDLARRLKLRKGD